jgi:hypothetical protein
MARSLVYYFNIISESGFRTQLTEAELRSAWTEIESSIDSLLPKPKKMYNEGIFTFNNSLMVMPPEDVPKALDNIYMMPDGYNKRILLKLADMGASLVPCEEPELLMAWRKNETELARKEEAGATISAEDIGKQSVYLLTRNKVIGQVISQSLSEDEAGVLFLGSVHNFNGMMANSYLRDTLGLNVIEMNPHFR